MDEQICFVWSKVNNNAGETIDDIVKRKEAERVAGDGLFYWGIGNSLGEKNLQEMSQGQSFPVLWTMSKKFEKQLNSKKPLNSKGAIRLGC
jgi:hypothetical protein